MDKRKNLITILGIIVVITALTGIAYAMITFNAGGTRINTITSGNINFSYTEGENNIGINNAYPTEDINGTTQDTYFQFTISSNTNINTSVPFFIFLTPNNANTLDDNFIKVYVTKVVDDEETQVLAPTTLGEILETYNPEDEALSTILFHDSFSLSGTSTTTSITESVYRLRLWVSSNYTGTDINGDALPSQTFQGTISVHAGN